jgi:hypothetical protein
MNFPILDIRRKISLAEVKKKWLFLKKKITNQSQDSILIDLKNGHACKGDSRRERVKGEGDGESEYDQSTLCTCMKIKFKKERIRKSNGGGEFDVHIQTYHNETPLYN